MFESIKIVLVEPTHPGNIGATARAMKNMGLSELVLVNPRVFPHSDAVFRAAGADDILENATVVKDLPAAIADCQRVYATSARPRDISWPVLTPREAATQAVAECVDGNVAILFGRESRGLSNQELALAHFHVVIPTNEAFSSLNLAAAVQVITYELRMATELARVKPVAPISPLATQEQVEGFISHLKDTLHDIEFAKPTQSKQLMLRLRRLFARTELETDEVNILRGILSVVSSKVRQ